MELKVLLPIVVILVFLNISVFVTRCYHRFAGPCQSLKLSEVSVHSPVPPAADFRISCLTPFQKARSSRRPILSFGSCLRQSCTTCLQCTGISSDDLQSSTTSSVLVTSSKAFKSGWRNSIHMQRPRLNTSASSRAFGQYLLHTKKTFHTFQPLQPGVVNGMLRRSGPVYLVYRRAVFRPSAGTSSTSQVPSISGAAVVTEHRFAPNL